MLDEIYTNIEDFSKIVIKGKTYNERKELLWRCYASNPKKEEVINIPLVDMVEYIKETDEFWDEDKKHIDACVALIKELE